RPLAEVDVGVPQPRDQPAPAGVDLLETGGSLQARPDLDDGAVLDQHVDGGVRDGHGADGHQAGAAQQEARHGGHAMRPGRFGRAPGGSSATRANRYGGAMTGRARTRALGRLLAIAVVALVLAGLG